MRGSLTKLILLAVYLPTLLLMAISGYFLIQNYQKYNEVKQSSKYLHLASKLEKLLVALGEERGISSIYSVSKGKYPNSKTILTQKRENFTKAANELKKFVNSHPNYYSDVAGVLSMLKDLEKVRKDIDSFKQNYIKTYFFTYYTKLESEIMKSQAAIFKKFPEEIKKSYELKFPFEKIIAYTGIIRGFSSYFLAADIPMSYEEYQSIFLKYYHDSNILPIHLLSEKIKKPLLSKEFKELESNIKEAIFYIQQANMNYYINDDFSGYPIDVMDNFTLLTKRIKYFNKVITQLNSQIDKNLQAITSEANSLFIQNIVIQIISLIMLILGYYLIKLIKEHIDELSKLMSSITPLIGKKVNIDISSTQGINEAIKVVEEAIKVIQQAIKDAQEATKAKTIFLANMSHEVRTPLNGILGFIELLEATPLNGEQRDYLNTVKEGAKNLLQIVNNILEVSKIENNKITLEEIEFKPLEEFENTLEIFALRASHKRIEYVADISPNLPKVLKGDILKLKEILTNLINNAIKFTKEKGTITVTIKLKELKNNKATIYFEVADTGIGISKEQKEKIFEAYAQANNKISSMYGGTGLGLTIVKSYIEIMGSDIHMQSELNKGSRFFFTLTFDVVDEEPKYQQNIFSDKQVAILKTKKESTRKEALLNYFEYFGIKYYEIENYNEIKDETKALVLFYEESDIENIEHKIPIIAVCSYIYKENIEKLAAEFSIFDPALPSKIYNIFTHIKRNKTPIKNNDHYHLTALVAEDNPINMKLLLSTLKNLGVETHTAQNGLEAFNKFTLNPFKYDVIFMDMQMPIMDGLEATKEIREFEKKENLPHTPIIAVTANCLKGDREKCIGAGMDDYIAKPINKEELSKILQNVSNQKYH
ncbi:MAG: response regulator [Epsilonproteobacteria bacterium]|nr:response regulator [Campylobacterota bacterium]